ncbi:MAG: hypothetical protein K0M70_08745, partial [Arenimonas sp.]|uniref:hypothetical protein n=1 Tax=Arenimonas sp. TaxID=1872635 RepID=UPI0025BB4B28
MVNTLSQLGVMIAGLYLAGLGAVALARPDAASRFLLAFVGSGPLHYLELVVRIVLGLAFVQQAPGMMLPAVFSAFGWLLVMTSAALLLVPWQWHRRFAERTVPQALRFLPLIGVLSLLLGGLVLAAAL